MEATRLTKSISILAIIGLFACSFAFSGSLSCAAGNSDVLVGAACTAETMTAPTIWSWNNEHVAVQTKQLAFFALVALLTLTLLPRAPRRDNAVRQWIRLVHPTLTKSGPIPNRTFIPYLYATHGW